MPRVVLLVPSSTYRAGPFLAAAAELHVEVVVASEQPLPGIPANRTLVVDIDDPGSAAVAIVDFDAGAPIDAVVGIDDRCVVAAAAASHALGLAHAAPDAVAATRDKLIMRRRLDAAEVDQPAFVAVDPENDLQVRIAGAAVGYPCVVKPTTLSASQGVIRADDPDSLAAAARRSAEIARRAGVGPHQPLLVEHFVPGPEVAVEATLSAGHLQVVAIFDKPDPLDGPYFEETIYLTPSRLSVEDRRAAIATTDAACRALGLDHGPVHAELRVADGRAQIVEVAARTIGGLCAQTVELATGQRLESLVLTNALGWPPPHTSRHRAAGVLMVPAPRSGRFVGVDGVTEARNIQGVSGIEITVAAGRHVAPAPDGSRYIGFVFSSALTPADAESALRSAWAKLRVQVADP